MGYRPRWMQAGVAVCIVLALGVVASCASPPTTIPLVGSPAPYLFVFAGDRDQQDADFLAIFDIDSDSPSRGAPISSIPTGMRHSMPHHTEYVPPPAGEPLFMNAHHHEATLVVDLLDLPSLKIDKTFKPPAPLRFPHDYARTETGTRLVSFLRSDGPSPVPGETLRPGNHGGIAEYAPSGALIRTVSAAVETLDKPVRPYAFALLPEQDRFVVTSATMSEPTWAEVVQLYRYSDFSLLRTMALRAPEGIAMPKGWNARATAFGVRRLDDGSVFLSTYECSLYHLTDIGTDNPELERVHTIDADDPNRDAHACGIPLRIGDFWIQPVAKANTVIVFDIADPRRPTEITRLRTPRDFGPHWLSRDPQSNRLVLGSEMGREQGFYILRIDEETGAVAFDDAFNGLKPGRFFRMRSRGYVSLERRDWPHGATGAAWGHAALFMMSETP